MKPGVHGLSTSGLSAGVEDREFRESPADSATTKTFAEAEASLTRTIRHATIGGTLPELTATRLDGSDGRLADYRGRVLLIDFWANWHDPNDEVVDPLAVSSYPTYFLVDERGEILARSGSLSEEFLSKLHEAVRAYSAG